MEKKELSVKELIDCARGCAGDLGCGKCHFCDEDNCTEALLLMLAGKLEEAETKWIPCKLAKPAEADEYLVMVAGAEKPTTLWYDPDEEMFYEEDGDETVWYPVTHWAMLPVGPNGTPSADGDGPSGTPVPTKEAVKRCATCAHEDKMAECDRCIACEKHNLWEERK